MNISSANVETLHAPSRNGFDHYASLPMIKAADLTHSTSVEQYAVITDHWCKCAADAKAFLLQSRNQLISAHARMIDSIMAAADKVAAA
ncbi:hypothetical protein Q1Z72_01560 [Pseudomonas qingdaonensis]|uniref:hypothetical protein n=1 Tax=Pseudomonas TaxID=286 RepID=UPI0021198356|nr:MULTISPECIES: hypothetical protein [Pseudomonas]UXH55914.1 hypothetical protein N5876_32725 [Pseudomonas aeruginosa]UXH68958.1 hypothetical protein N5879_32850 [Pseudomonas aeruginosa]WKL67382.1 hypothetical protein Q1Z72_01560 [Pseudomonas qingdaonensis]